MKIAPRVVEPLLLKHYAINGYEEEAIEQAEICMRLLQEQMVAQGKDDKALLLDETYEALKGMRERLEGMPATRTPMGYN